ncbi:hypothetical protein N0V94_005552 [Neodidymelliopsis sp. IMI 364377]|nr:hypothetical protein N0V94_005552 [Neodidymelliopsis sp. IMI 364377]
MADPVSIVGLLSGAITFVEFGYKLVSGTKNIRESLNGRAQEMDELELRLEEVNRFYNSINAQIAAGQTTSNSDAHMTKLVKECETICRELRRLMDKLVVRKKTTSKTWESSRVAFRALLNRKEIENLTKRLESLDQLVHRNIERNLNVLDSQAAELTSLKTKLDVLQKELVVNAKQDRILRSLYFPEIHRRLDQIETSHQGSNEWIFDPVSTSFVPWLEGSGNTDQIFYITGQAGSGKSTLMKFVSDHERTQGSLEAWANPAKLCTASYYFWNQGSEMQKSGLGLFQSLLYQMFREIPDLITLVSPDHLEHEVWDMESLAASFKRIGKQPTLKRRFCFFVDGLDEYAGEESDIVRLLDVIAEGSYIKLCVSSRPGRVYEEHLRRGNQGFDIANFTKDDIREYVHERLHSSTKFQSLAYQDQNLQNMGDACQDLITDISQRARGVWLWVFLVTRELCSEAERDEPIASLLKVVDEFPPDLDGYFKRIIENIKPRHRDKMARAFLMMVEASRPIPLYTFELIRNETENPNYALEAPLKPFTDEAFELQYPAWKSRLQSRCGDLVVVSNDPVYSASFLQPHVEFLHRSVADFLRDTYQHHLSELLETPFEPLISLVQSLFYIFKCLPPPLSDNQEFILIEMLRFMQDMEQGDNLLEEESFVKILDEVSRLYSIHAANDENAGYRWIIVQEHDGKPDILGTTVFYGLYAYVHARTRSDPTLAKREGCPLLYYALGLFEMVISYSRGLSVVRLLLERGADPNQRVKSRRDQTVWELFLQFIEHRSKGLEKKQDILKVFRDDKFPICKALIRAGADPDLKIFDDIHEEENVDEVKHKTIESILEDIFSPEQVTELKQELEAHRKPQEKPSSSCVTM